jgi:tetratricopeptide (TPR) repeat protein
MTYRCHFAVIAFLLTCGVARAEDAWPVKRGSSREPAPYRYDAKSWTKVPRDFLDDYAACILYYGTNHTIEADGTVETTTHEITRLNGRRGIESLGEYRGISYDPTWQTLVLNEARILKADGKIVAIEVKDVQLRDVSTDYQVYDKDKQLVISFPNLEVGDCFEVKWTTRGKNPQFDGRFFGRLTFGDDQYPTVRDELRVRLPKSMPIHHTVKNGKVGAAVKEEMDRKIYHWWSDERRPMPQDADRPSKDTLRLQVMFSTFASWDEVGQWKEKLRADCWTCTPEVKELVYKLTRDLKTPLDKARALTYWVRKSIRYVSISSGAQSFRPRQPHTVFTSRYGDCKDQAQLLAVMLKEAGIDVSLVTLGTLDDGQVLEEVPSPWGTHGILLANIDGKEHWIDTTVTLSGWNFLPRADRDRVVYVTKDSKLRLMRTPGLTYADNRFVQVTEMHVMPDGTSVSRRAMHYAGLAAVSRRDAWLETPPGERRRQLTAELQDANSASRLNAFHVSDKELANLDKDVTARMDYAIAGHFSGDFDSREGSITDSVVWNRLLAYTLDTDRLVALNLGSPFESLHRYIIRLPPAFRFKSPPEDHEVKSKWGTFAVRVKGGGIMDPQRLEITFHTRLERTHVDPPEFADFQRFHKDVFRHWRAYITIQPANNPLELEPLEHWQRMTLGADYTSTLILARLYLEVERKKDARRVLARARDLFPDAAELWDLSVKCADTSADEEGLYLEMMRRFPKELKYALGLGSVRVRRSDHDGARDVLLPLTKLPRGPRGTNYYAGEAFVQLAMSAAAQHQPALALAHLDAALDFNRGSIDLVLPFKARVYEELGRLDDAIDTYRKAGDAIEVLTALARVELKAGRTRDALDTVRRLVVFGAKDRHALAQAAEFYYEIGKHEDALDVALRARDLGFSDRTQKLLGQIHFHMGDFAKAVFHLERADDSAATRELLLRGLIAQGKLHEAIRQTAPLGNVDSSLGLREIQATLVHLARRRAAVLHEIPELQLGVLAKRRAEVLKLVQKAEGLSRIDAAAKIKSLGIPTFDAFDAVDMLVCTEHLHRTGRPVEEVEKLLSAVFASGVELGPAYALRAQLALDKGKLREALADAELAVHHAPKFADGYYLRGRVRLERGDYGALGDLLRAADLTGYKDGVIVFWLAQAQEYIGRRGEALASLNLAATLLPRDPHVQTYLRKLVPPLK